MILAQTNIQLYNQLTRQGRGSSELIVVREAYELSCQLFSDSFRPSHKPFTSHLIGVSSALASWNQETPVVVAGLLHSCYLYGRFGDKQSGVTQMRRDYVRSKVGAEAEELVYQYTVDKTNQPFESENTSIRIIKIADFLDELSDLGPAYAKSKQLPELVAYDQTMKDRLVDLYGAELGGKMTEDLDSLITSLQESEVPGVLTANETAFYRVRTGVTEFRTAAKNNVLAKAKRLLLRGKA